MSSDGSVMSSVSRIRQFGLYRSIDARTEEFLRASRKRQIRQGCACAAVSTAITVTVVVSVILVYEYSINGESNHNKKFTLKPNWIGFMNESTDVTQVSSKFTKKINIDKTTMKLLPILIKALNTNRYLEKLLEEYTSTSPASDKKETTEFPFNKNVFDKKKWIKMPTTRLYTADYKSSTTLLKMPANNLDYFQKRKKMKDYQRMLNYFDKMVGDKMGSSQQAITNVFTSTKSPPLKHYVTPSVKIHKHKTIKPETTTMIVSKVLNDKKEDTSCKCPKNLGVVLNKILNSLRGMIPNVIGKNLSPCENKTSTSTTTAKVLVKSKEKGQNWRNPFYKTTTDTITPKNTQPSTTKKKIEGSTFSSTDSNIIFHKISFSEDASSPFTPNFKGDYNRYYSFHGNKFTTVSKHTETSTIENIITKSVNTLPMTTEHILNQDRPTPVTPVTFTSTSERTFTESPVTTTTIPPDYDYYSYDGNNETTIIRDDKAFKSMHNSVPKLHPTINQSFIEQPKHEFDWNSLKKIGFLPKHFDPNPSLHKKGKDFTNTEEDLNNTREINEATQLPPSKVIQLVSTPTLTTETTLTDYPSYQDTPHEISVPIKNTHLANPIRSKETASGNKFTIIKTNDTQLDGSPKTQSDANVNQEINVNNIITDIDLDKVPDEDFQQEELNSKQLEPPADNNSKLLHLWDILKTNKKSTKSMLPPIRPVYLEVQRSSDWRHENHHDYDFNDNNNAFDMPNI